MKRLTELQFKELASIFQKMRNNLEINKEKELYKRLLNKIKEVPFYRLEKDGLGPWYSFRDKNYNKGEHWLDDNMFRLSLERDSSFVTDVWRFCKKESLHACYSKENLYKWFSKNELILLKHEGYEIKEYYLNKDFNDIFLADNQVLLLKDKTIRDKTLKKTYDYRKKENERNNRFFEEVLCI